MFSAGDAPVSEPPPRPFSPPVAVLGLEAGEDKEGCAGGLRHPKGGARRREGGGASGERQWGAGTWKGLGARKAGTWEGAGARTGDDLVPRSGLWQGQGRCLTPRKGRDKERRRGREREREIGLQINRQTDTQTEHRRATCCHRRGRWLHSWRRPVGRGDASCTSASGGGREGDVSSD